MPQLDKKNSVVCIDPNGDLTLVIGPDKVRMQVDANTLRRASKAFDRMLFGSFVESDRTPKWTVELPVDDPEALEVIFNAAHADMRKVPRNLELSVVYNIAVMADKYLMVDWLRPWTSTWKSTIKNKYLRKFYKNGTTYQDLQKLCVMCYFGTVEELKKIVVPLIFETRAGRSGEQLLFRMTTDTDGVGTDGVDSEKKVKEWETFWPLPQWIIDFVRNTRRRMISWLLDVLWDIFNNYTREHRGLTKGGLFAARRILVDYIERENLGYYIDSENPWFIPCDDGQSVVELYNLTNKIKNHIESSVTWSCRCYSCCPLVLPNSFGPKWRAGMEEHLVYWEDLESKMRQD